MINKSQKKQLMQKGMRTDNTNMRAGDNVEKN